VAATSAGCGPEENLSAFDVSIVAVDDCVQVGQGAVSCADPEELSKLVQRGRWILDDRGGENMIVPLASFILTDESGATLPGYHLPNDGTYPTSSCTGQGGQCYLAQDAWESVNKETGCPVVEATGADFFVFEQKLEGISVFQHAEGFQLVCDEDGNCSQNAVEGCETFVSIATAKVTGTAAKDLVLAREVNAP